MSLPHQPRLQEGSAKPPQQQQSLRQEELQAGLTAYPHYLAGVSRQDVEALLLQQPKGCFLVRKSSQPHSWVISLRQPQQVIHLLVVPRLAGADGGRSFGLDPVAWNNHSLGDRSFNSVPQLVDELQRCGFLNQGYLPPAAVSNQPLPGDGAYDEAEEELPPGSVRLALPRQESMEPGAVVPSVARQDSVVFAEGGMNPPAAAKAEPEAAVALVAQKQHGDQPQNALALTPEYAEFEIRGMFKMIHLFFAEDPSFESMVELSEVLTKDGRINFDHLSRSIGADCFSLVMAYERALRSAGARFNWLPPGGADHPGVQALPALAPAAHMLPQDHPVEQQQQQHQQKQHQHQPQAPQLGQDDQPVGPPSPASPYEEPEAGLQEHTWSHGNAYNY